MSAKKDLIDLNRRLMEQTLGRKLQPSEAEYLDSVSVCIGRFKPTVPELHTLLDSFRLLRDNPLPVMYANRDYLNYARLRCKEAESGDLSRLVELDINIATAEVIAGLSNDEVTRIALKWQGLVVSCHTEPLRVGPALHTAAGRLHAAAFQCACG